MNSMIIWLARYEGYFAHICRGLRNKDKQCIKQAARLFDVMLPEGAAVIPMPSHRGNSDVMFFVAEEIKKLRPDINVYDILHSDFHESSYDQKKCGNVPKPFKMRLDLTRKPIEGKPFVIDSVVVSGVTASAAIDATDFPVLCLCRDMWR